MHAVRRAVVVGGGIAGLSWALAAAERGYAVTVLEASGRFGGAIRRGRIGPVDGELGAEAFATARPAVLELIDRLGLDGRIVRPTHHQAHLRSARGTQPLPPGLLGIPLDHEGIAATLGADTAREASERDRRPVPALTALPDTLGGLVRDRLGDAVAEHLVDPVVAAVHATPADEAELATVLPTLADAVAEHGGLLPAARALRGSRGAAGAPVATLAGGLSTLVTALVDRLGVTGADLRRGVRVTELTPNDGGWIVTTDSGGFEAEVVCLALPPAATATVLDHAGNPAQRTLMPLLRRLRPSPVAVVSLLLEDRGLTDAGAPLGSGVLVAPDAREVRAKAMTHLSAKWAHVAAAMPADHHLLRLSYGLRTGEDATDRSDDELAAAAALDATTLLGDALAAPHVRATRVTRWRDGLVRPILGRAATVAAIESELAGLSGLALTGGAVAGNGLAAVVARSWSEADRTLA